jgi:hypothetical protein
MGRIIPPPKPANYDGHQSMVVAQVKLNESIGSSEYARVLELLEYDGVQELRFSYYVRDKGQGNQDWRSARKHVNMRPRTFAALIRKAKFDRQFGLALKRINVS